MSASISINDVQLVPRYAVVFIPQTTKTSEDVRLLEMVLCGCLALYTKYADAMGTEDD